MILQRTLRKITEVDARTINALTLDKNGNLLTGTSANGAYVVDTRSNRVLASFYNRRTAATTPLQTMGVSSICIYNDTSYYHWRWRT